MFFDPRKRWDLMSSSFNPSITRDASGEIPRIHPGAWARSIHHGQMMGPNYGTSGNAAINAAMASQASQTPTAPYQGMEPTATLNSAAMPKKKGFFGNIMGKLNEMTEEEKKDFREVLQEGDFRIDQEFLAGGKYGRTQEYAHQPFLFDESTAAEYQRRRKLNPYV